MALGTAKRSRNTRLSMTTEFCRHSRINTLVFGVRRRGANNISAAEVGSEARNVANNRGHDGGLIRPGQVCRFNALKRCNNF
jgi:hypothetical protein